MKPLRICISPLDWGLGHATRCIPIIQALQSLGHAIYIGVEGHHEVILREAFPTATFLHLRGYRVRYTKKRSLFFLNILLQGPKILYSAINEYWWLKKMHRDYQFDLIIADNRVGFFHKKVTSIFITHQLHLIMPYRWATWLFQQIQYLWLNNFSACWVPDIEGPNNLSGILANPKQKPSIPLWYMGCLSRLYSTLQDEVAQSKSEIEVKDKITFLGIVSGPEPQRGLLENILWVEGNQINKKFVLVAGLPLNKKYHKASANGIVFNHLNGPALAQQIQRAEYIICRGGYTSLMELIPFGKKLIFVPTPGQTEQEYLGALWQKNKWALCYSQSDFTLATALKEGEQLNFVVPPFKPLSTAALNVALKQLNL